jgi:hypothetical protein
MIRFVEAAVERSGHVGIIREVVFEVKESPRATWRRPLSNEPRQGPRVALLFPVASKEGARRGISLVTIKMNADGFIGPEGSPTSYISFDLATAEQIRADIDECIAIIRHFSANDSA